MKTKHGIEEKIIAIGHGSCDWYKFTKYLARKEDEKDVIEIVKKKQQERNEYYNISTRPYRNDPDKYVWIIEG